MSGDLGAVAQDVELATNRHAQSAEAACCISAGVNDGQLITGRQKRKRTSPEDQATLEAAYQRDPKPDKAARLELVERVALGEKEVQIWFQNRRQNSRRKSRPLLPHEIVQYQLARSGLTAQDIVVHEDFQTQALESPTAEAAHGSELGARNEPLARAPSATNYATDSRVLANDAHLPSRGHVCLHNSTHAAGLQGATSFSSTPRLVAESPSRNGKDNSQKHLKAGASRIGLSLSSDGNASIVTKLGASPSPPRPPHHVMLSVGSVARPASMAKNGESSSASGGGSLQRSSNGRSRDSRAWQFWCDKDSRDELERLAERDSMGSAAGAIGILRQASGNHAAATTLPKRSAPMRRPLVVNNSKRNMRRLSLQNSHKSHGRLQRANLDPCAAVGKRKSKLDQPESALSTVIAGNDSDKENWSPGAVQSNQSNNVAIADGKVQTGPGNIPETKIADNTVTRNERDRDKNGHFAQLVLSRDCADHENEAEYAAFMRGGRQSRSPSNEDELDCVHAWNLHGFCHI